MRILTPRRLLALTISAACVVLMVSPAASAEIADGTIEVTADNSDTFDLELDAGSLVCPTSTIDVDLIGSSSTGTVTVTDIDVHMVDTLLGDEYYVYLTDDTALGDSQTGIYAAGSISGLDLGLRAEIYESDVDTCEPDDLACVLYFDLDLTGTYTGTPPSALNLVGGSGDHGLTPDLVCDAPFATFIDGTLLITDPIAAT